MSLLQQERDFEKDYARSLGEIWGFFVVREFSVCYLHVEQSTAYKRKNRALDRLTVLLFGKS